MAVTQLDVLKIAVGMFAGAPSAKTTKMLAEWKGDARSLFATIGESVYTNQVSDYKGLDAKAAAALLVQNLGGDTLTAEVKGWATTWVENALANNKGNIGLVAYEAVNFLSTTEDANYAGVRKQLENRLAVAEKYVASTQGSETDSFAILKNVTSNEVSRDKAIMDITGVDPSEVIIEGAIQLTNKADTPVLTAGDDIVQGLKGTLNSTDIIIDAQTSDKDFLKAVITSDNDNANPVIRRIETIEVDFKGFGLGLNAENIQDGTLKITSTQANNKSADITGLASLATQNLVLDVAKNITELDLRGEGAKVVLNGQDINITTATITEMEIQSVDTASSVTTNYTGNLKVHGDQNLTIKDSNTATAANITNELAAGKVLTIEAQASSPAGADLSKAGAAVIALNKAADSSANRTLTFANNATVKLGADNALSGAGVITLSTAEMNNLNVEVNHAQTAQKVKVDQVGVLNFEVNGNPAKALSGLELTSTRGNTDNIKVTAGKSVAFSDVTTQSRSLNVTVDAATTFANIKTSANAASGAATFTINAATKVTGTTTGLELENKVANFTIHADTEIAQFKGTNTNKTTWSFSGDKNIKLGNGNFSVGRATLNFADTAGEVSIASLTTAGTTGVTVLGGQGNLTAQGSTGNDSMFGGAGNDLLNGASGNDSLVGGAGNDTLVAGAGTDTLEGGAGNDVFVLGVGTVVNDYKFGEDRVVLTGAEATANSFNEVKNAADGSIGGVGLGAEVNGKAHTELLQFGFDKGSNAFTLDNATTDFVGSDHGDFVKEGTAATAAFSVRLGKGDDYLELNASTSQAATIVFEDNAANNGKDTITGFNIAEDKLNFNQFLGDGYKVAKTDGTDLAGGTTMATATSGAFDLTDSTNANINISGKVAVVETSQSELVSLKAEDIILKAFTNGEFQVEADKKAVVILTAGDTASVAYVENNGDAAITANEITIVGMIEANAAWSTATPVDVGA